jgi:hypothetical protein
MLSLALIAPALCAAAQPVEVPPVSVPQERSDAVPYQPCSMVGLAGPLETRIRNMSEYIEAVVDPQRGVYIQGYTGQWYYARVRTCPRLHRGARLRFEPSPGGDFDRNSMIRADGWRCFIDSVTEVEGLPRRDS